MLSDSPYPTPGARNAPGRPLRGSRLPAAGWCAPPSVAAAPPLRRAALPLCPSRPALLAAPDSRRRLLGGWRCHPPYSGPAGAASRGSRAVALRAHRAGARMRDAQRETWTLSDCRPRPLVSPSERVGAKVWAEIPRRPHAALCPRGRHRRPLREPKTHRASRSAGRTSIAVPRLSTDTLLALPSWSVVCPSRRKS
jgi:hypothetical protein